MLVNEFKQRYFDSVANLLWRQWSCLGVSAQIAHEGSRYLLDPEALMIFSAKFCRYDQRLYDLILDWLRVNGTFVNIQRLKSLVGKSLYKDTASLGYIAALMNDFAGRRWGKLADEFLPNKPVFPAPMFIDINQETVTFCHHKDEIALHYGFIRNPYVPTGKVTGFPSDSIATVLLQLRGIFGVSARVETILVLLNKDVCKIQNIADLSGFSWKSIQDVLTEMTAAGFTATSGGRKRGRHYFLKSPEKIKNLFGAQNLYFPDWRRIFDVLGIIWETVANPRLADLSEQTFKSELKRIFEDEIGEILLNVGVSKLEFINAETVLKLPELLNEI